MNSINASKFIRKRRNTNARKLFHLVVGYFAFCYEKSIKDKVTYSLSYIQHSTSAKVEDFLKKRFVIDYLRKRENKLAYQKELFRQTGMKVWNIEKMSFYPETEVEYIQDSILRDDKIDVFVTNLPLEDYWADIDNESLYFVFEFKRLQNTKKNTAYISDTKKFVSRTYTQFRFPYNGMVGIVEKSSISITDIINDIEKKLTNHSVIKSITKKGSTEILKPFTLIKHKDCRISRHSHNKYKGTIEVIHLFFDYSNIII